MNRTAELSIDEFWEELAPYVQWPEGFALVLLFAGYSAPVERLAERLERSLDRRARSLRRLEPTKSEDVERLVVDVVAKPSADCGALWVALWSGGGDRSWDDAVRNLLQRLNERRYLLEREVAVPVVLVLSPVVQPTLHAVAPDLWTIRSFGGRVPEPPRVSRSVPRVTDISSALPSAVEREWARQLGSQTTRGQLAAADGLRASRSALDRGDLEAARHMALEALTLAIRGQQEDPAQLEILGVDDAWAQISSLDRKAQQESCEALALIGEVELRVGDLEAAARSRQRVVMLTERLEVEASRGQSLDARRALAQAWSALAEVLAEAVDRPGARRALYRVIEILEGLVSRTPDDPGLRRELSTAFKQLADLELGTGAHDAARDAFRRSADVLQTSTSAVAPAARVIPRVFISYSHDSGAHEQHVLALADLLRSDGIAVSVDQYVAHPPEGWLRWSERQIIESDFVIFVCTATYRRRFEGSERRNSSTAVAWEVLMANRLQFEMGSRNESLIPILFTGGTDEDIPRALRSLRVYRMPTDYDELYQRLIGSS
ncbi:MAG: SEFIR domain-containing protein [Myxococcota bacterium]